MILPAVLAWLAEQNAARPVKEVRHDPIRLVAVTTVQEQVFRDLLDHMTADVPDCASQGSASGGTQERRPTTPGWVVEPPAPTHPGDTNCAATGQQR